MGTIGFSQIGLIFILMLTIPNIIWSKYKPKGYDPSFENKTLVAFERVGQILVTCTVLMFNDYDSQPPSFRSVFFALAVILMILYELWWIRYFRSDRTLADFYSSYLKIPLAGATLPVIAFFLLGLYADVMWLMASTVILGIGHIGIHWQHYKELKNPKNHENGGKNE